MNKPSLQANKHGCPIIFYQTVIANNKQGRGNKSVTIITDLMPLPYRRDRLKDIKGKSAGHRHVEQHKLHTLLYIAGQHLRLKNGGLVIGS